MGNLECITQPADRNGCNDFLQHIFRHSRHHVGRHIARCHRVGGNTELGVFSGEDPVQADEAALGSGDDDRFQAAALQTDGKIVAVGFGDANEEYFIAITLTGFIPDSLAKLAAIEAGERAPFPLVLHVHSVLMGLFLLLLLAQTTLAATHVSRPCSL